MFNSLINPPQTLAERQTTNTLLDTTRRSKKPFKEETQANTAQRLEQAEALNKPEPDMSRIPMGGMKGTKVRAQPGRKRGSKLTLQEGQKVGEWTLQKWHPADGPKVRGTWHCVCSCGTERFVSTSNLTSGMSRSCGCQGKKQVQP